MIAMNPADAAINVKVAVISGVSSNSSFHVNSGLLYFCVAHSASLAMDPGQSELSFGLTNDPKEADSASKLHFFSGADKVGNMTRSRQSGNRLAQNSLKCGVVRLHFCKVRWKV